MGAQRSPPFRPARLGGSVLTLLAIAMGLLIALGTNTPLRAATPLEQFVKALEQSYRGVRSLKAEFRQTHVWGVRRRTESGVVVFARGGRMRWEYREPSEKLFLSDGKKVFLYVPEDQQVTWSSVKESDDLRVPFRLLLSRLDLRKVFSKIEFADDVQPQATENRVLRAHPKRDYEDLYREVLMEVTPGFDIQRLVVFYPDRSSMEFHFRQIERNAATSPTLFRFTPPPGAEVIEQP